jgi:hypothetical protein
MHSFILNEMQGERGTGVLPELVNDYADTIEISSDQYAETQSITIFADEFEIFELGWLPKASVINPSGSQNMEVAFRPPIQTCV